MSCGWPRAGAPARRRWRPAAPASPAALGGPRPSAPWRPGPDAFPGCRGASRCVRAGTGAWQAAGPRRGGSRPSPQLGTCARPAAPSLGFSAVPSRLATVSARGSDPHRGHPPALPAAAVGLTYSSEEVAVLGESHERLRQLSEPLLEDTGDGMDGEILQLDGCGVCGEAGRGGGQVNAGRRAVPEPPAPPRCPPAPDTHLSAVPVVAPVCGWQRLTCGRGLRCTGRASPHVPEASPAQWARRPCHWSGCPRTHQSGLARHLARSVTPEVGVRSVWAPSLPAPHPPYRLLGVPSWGGELPGRLGPGLPCAQSWRLPSTWRREEQAWGLEMHLSPALPRGPQGALDQPSCRLPADTQPWPGTKHTFSSPSLGMAFPGVLESSWPWGLLTLLPHV